MVIDLATLVAHPGLQLKVLSGEDSLERPVHSVAVSELLDPTSYLMGGEFVLTSGMRLPSDLSSLEEYVDRLVVAGAVALGFGIGVTAESTPEPLVLAAARRGLVIVEVGQQTPFVAVVRALSEIVVAEERSQHVNIRRDHQALARAARTGGPRGVVRMLATQLAGDVLLLDGGGRPRAWSSDAAIGVLAACKADVEKVRKAKGGDARAGMSIIDGTRRVLLQGLGSGRSTRGVLVVSTMTAMSKLQRDLVAGAAAILSFGIDQESPTAQRLLRQAALIRLVRSGSAPAPDELAVLSEGLLGGGALVVAAATGEPSALSSWCEHLQDLGEERAIAGTIEARAYALVHADAIEEVTGVAGLAVGVSRAVPPEHLRSAFDDAEQACKVARVRGIALVRYADVTTGALGVADPGPAKSFAVEFLQPLDDYAAASGVDLRMSLTTWLKHHGHFGPAAQELGIHRHTLRQRINRAAQLLDRDLEDIETRFDLWFALQVSSPGPRDEL
ncbi:PucR family transcriptional regulator [Demetria terragena]|uniref:PucR family transcriptional regulator n=1 Tax=Demetria terragena TaxID=63959 RepID=UPI0003AACC1C|nr:PucR family transcriptional regulator [Demetria terragena]